MQSNIMVVNCL